MNIYSPYIYGSFTQSGSTSYFKENLGVGFIGGMHPSALFEVSGTTKGVLFPRMTEAQKNAISSPATSLLIYQTDSASGYQYYNGTAWTSFGGSGTFTGGTVTGPTIFTGGVTANTISATTYQNLPTDVRVTGGTYSSGTATFTNNTGGTFNVTGFSTGTTTLDNRLLLTDSSTGLITFGGLSATSGGTTFNVGAIKAWFVDNYTDPVNPVRQYVELSAQTGISVTNISGHSVTYVAVDSGGTIYQQATVFNPSSQRSLISLGVIVHTNRIFVNTINNQPVVASAPLSQLNDLIEGIGFFNINGNVFSPNGANLNINKSSGDVFKQGANFMNDNKNPHTLFLSGLTAPSNIRYRLQTGVEYANTAVIDPNNYDLNGVLTPVNGSKYTIQRINVFQSNLVRIQYGQQTYANLADAIQGISIEPFVVEDNILDNGLFRALLLVKANTTDLTITADALFIEAGKFGSTAGLGSLSTTTLQQAYNNSTAPEILINSTLGGLSIQNGTGNANNVTNLLEGLNSTGSITSLVRADGYISGTTFQTNGFNANSNGVTATTVTATTISAVTFTGNLTGTASLATSATTALNSTQLNGQLASFYYPASNPNGYTTNTGTVTQVNGGNGMNFTNFTTSGTITMGTPSSTTLASTNATTTNSHTHAFAPGGTTGQYITGAGTLVTFPTIVNTFVTGTTFNNATYDLTLTRNDGVTMTANLGLLATDVKITGGTYNINTGVVTFTNTTGGTFNVTGFTSGMTDTFVTGGTYAAGTATFTRSNNVSFNVTGFNTGTTVGSGTANYLTKWTGSTALGNSIIRDDGSNIGINTPPQASAKVNIYTSTNSNALYVQNQTLNGAGMQVIANGNGSQIGILAQALGGITDNNTGIAGYAQDGNLAIGIRGEVKVSEFGTVTTGIGGYFDGRGDFSYSIPTSSYSVQLIDGTEGIDKVLVSKTSDGKANWSSSLSGLTSVSATTISATTFTGNLTGLASLATSATTALNATNAVNVGVTNNTSTNAIYYPTFVSSTSGNQAIQVDSTTLTFNPSTNLLTTGAISATTYQNLPADIRVTGGTYSTGTATFRNNTGGTFTVTGFNTGTVSSVAALTLGTTGTDLNSTVANGTTTPVITLNVPDASATARGVITTGVQTIAGVKTLTSQLNGTVANFSQSSAGTSLTGYNGGVGGTGVSGGAANGIGGYFVNNSTTNPVVRLLGLSNTRLLEGRDTSDNITSAIWSNGDISGTSFIRTGGTAAQFLKANGSVDSTTYVPTSRTLTINGTAFDLSANRSWTIAVGTGTVTQVNSGNGMNFTNFTTSGTITMGTPSSTTLASINTATTNSHSHAFTPGGTTGQYITGAGTLVTFPTIPTVNDGTLTLATSGIATGSASFTANQAGGSTFTVAVPATDLSIGVSSGAQVRIDSSTGADVYIPVASTTLAGIVTTGTQTFGGPKTFTDNLQITSTSSPSIGFDTTGTTTGTMIVNSSFFQFTAKAVSGYLFKNYDGNNILSIGAFGNAQFSNSVTASSFVKTGGTSTQFLKADGSVDSTTYTPTSRTLTINGTAFDLSADRSWTITSGGFTGGTVTGPTIFTGGVTANTLSATTVIANNFTGLASLATSATTTLNATNATNSVNVGVTNNTTTNAVYYPTFVSATSGNNPLQVDSGALTFNPSTNTLSVPNLAGNASTATSAGVATNSDYIYITEAATTNANYYIPFADATNSYSRLWSDAGRLYYNPSTDTLYASNLDGNASTATQATNATNVNITEISTAPVDYYLTFVGAVSGNNSLGVDSTTLSYRPNTSTLTVPFITGLASLATSATTALSTDKIDNINFRNSDQTTPISAPDTLDSNGIGYVTNISLYGQVDGALYAQAYSSAWQHQIFGDYRTGQMAVRGKNSGTWQAWRNILDSTNFTNYAVPTGRTLTINGTTFDLSANRSWTIAASGGITGAGTSAYIPKFTGTTAIGNSLMYDNGSGIGVNTTTPGAYKLNVNGALYASTINTGTYVAAGSYVSAGSYGQFKGSGTGAKVYIGDPFSQGPIGVWEDTSSSDIAVYYATSGEYTFANRNLRCDISTGYVSVGGSQTGAGRFEVLGDNGGGNVSIYATNDIIAFSDISIKENLRPIENVLERVSKSRGVLYDRTDNNAKNNIGFVAQELEEQFPELVSTNPDGTKAVKYQNATAVLFEAVKEQQKQIDSLQEQINNILAKLDK